MGRKLDLQELCFPLGIVLFVGTLLSLALIYFNIVPYAWEFGFFVFSIACSVSSLACLAVDLFYMWSAQEPCPYYPMVPSLERSESHPVVRIKNPKPQKAKTMNVEPPSREELQRLKEVLGISQGSLQYKKRGQGVYHVLYNEGKYRWRHLDSWVQLKEKLEPESSVE